MVRRNTMSERDFLKNFALRQFGNQKGEVFNIKTFDIAWIEPMKGYHIAYEIRSLDPVNKFNLRMHLTIGLRDNLQPFRLNVFGPFIEKELDDEVWTTRGEIDSGHHLYGGYPFLPFGFERYGKPYLVTYLREPITQADGTNILLTEHVE